MTKSWKAEYDPGPSESCETVVATYIVLTSNAYSTDLLRSSFLRLNDLLFNILKPLGRTDHMATLGDPIVYPSCFHYSGRTY